VAKPARGTPRWELSDEELVRYRASRGAIGPGDLLRAFVRHPSALLDAFQATFAAAAGALRATPGLLWLVETERVRKVVPEAAPGATWSEVETFLQVLLPRLRARDRVLEVGAGAGRVSRLVSPHVAELVCLDASRAMLAEAKRNLAHLPNVRLVRSRGFTLSAFSDCEFDAVYSHDVFRELDPLPALALIDSCHRVLRPGGILVLSLETIDPPDWARRELAKVRRAARAGHFGPTYARPYMASQIEAFFNLAGLEVVDRRSSAAADPYLVLVGQRAAEPAT
jgi:ubiquinone/menaquinone biosynthesis C-methylase UbiE